MATRKNIQPPKLTVLQEASDLVNGERNQDYGNPVHDFQCTVDMWNAYLQRRGILLPNDMKLEPHDLANMMILLKMSREAHQHKRDNLVDAAGYAECSQQVQDYYNS